MKKLAKALQSLSCKVRGFFFILIVTVSIVHAGLTQAGIREYLFGLNGDNTVYDFMAASSDARIDWMLNMCNDGECLNKIDWRCGFDNHDNYDEVVSDCFYKLAPKLEPWVKIDLLRKYCGVGYAKFTGTTGSPERCKAKGGTWGQKSKVILPDRSLWDNP